MANILLTERCNRKCPYCFAKKQMDESEDQYLSWENLIYILDFLENSKQKRASFLGGEPTLHPLFIDFTIYALERGFQLNVFTSGIMPDKKMEEAISFLRHISPEKFSFTCNLNHPSLSSPSELRSIDRFLAAFHPYTTLGYNIYQEKFNLEFLFKKILEFNLNKHVRIGLSHPIPNEMNRHIEVGNLAKMGQSFMEHYELFERLNVAPSFDCGMPLCIFDEKDLGRLYKITGNRLVFSCGPAIDIGPDMTVWSCFPLAHVKKRSIFDFNTIKEIHHYFNSVQDKVRIESGGIYEACDTCSYRSRNLCMGGCLAHFVSQHEIGKSESEVSTALSENASHG